VEEERAYLMGVIFEGIPHTHKLFMPCIVLSEIISSEEVLMEYMRHKMSKIYIYKTHC
jgi:hypothetical protein